MLTCKQLTENASHYIEGETTLKDRLSLRFHLLICDHCRRFLKQFRVTTQLIPMVNQEKELSDQMLDKLATELKMASEANKDRL